MKQWRMQHDGSIVTLLVIIYKPNVFLRVIRQKDNTHVATHRLGDKINRSECKNRSLLNQ